jgi:adenylate cyclase class IV
LRLEIAFKIDKKKNEKKEFYFSSQTKIFLTRKRNTRVREKNKKEFRRQFVGDGSRRCSEAIKSIHVAVAAIPDLTELTRARNFPASRVPLGWPLKCGRRTRTTTMPIALLIGTGAQYAEFF